MYTEVSQTLVIMWLHSTTNRQWAPDSTCFLSSISSVAHRYCKYLYMMFSPQLWTDGNKVLSQVFPWLIYWNNGVVVGTMRISMIQVRAEFACSHCWFLLTAQKLSYSVWVCIWLLMSEPACILLFLNVHICIWTLASYQSCLFNSSIVSELKQSWTISWKEWLHTWTLCNRVNHTLTHPL